MSEDPRRELAARTAVAAAMAGAGVASPDLAAFAAMATPAAEMVFSRLLGVISERRWRHIEETVSVAADERSQPIEDLLAATLASDDNHQLFLRVATVAQDAALAEKRIALGRALAAGLDADEAAVNGELLFVRAVADLDAPHIHLLRRMSQPREGIGQMAGHALIDGWTVEILRSAVPALASHLPSLLATLEQHGLVESDTSSSYARILERSYHITDQGCSCLQRLTIEPGPETQTGTDRRE